MNRDNFLKNNIIGSEYWVNSGNKHFVELCNDNMMLYNDWKNITNIKETEYLNKIIKPINKYALYFYPKPELIKKDNHIILRQKTHAEIWIEPRKNFLYALDKTWQRQFYPSNNLYETEKDCFDAVFKFYTPWIIDADTTFQIKEIENSPFKILNKTISFFKFDYDKNVVDAQWVDFMIKKNGKHIKNYYDEVYGIIDLATPAYDILIHDPHIIDRILLEYEQ
jgi:hypothetical protein